MAEETQAYALAFVGALDDPRNVGDDEGEVVTVADYAEVGLEGREGVAGDLGLRAGHRREQRGLPGVGKPYKAHVGKEFELEDEPAFLAFLAGLCVARRLVGRAFEIVIAKASSATSAEDELLAGIEDLGHDLVGLGVLDGRPDGDVEVDILAVFAPAEGETARAARLSPDHLPVFQVDQRPELRIGAQDDMATPTTITPVRASLRDVLCPMEMCGPRSSVAGGTENLDVVYEVGFSHTISERFCKARRRPRRKGNWASRWRCRAANCRCRRTFR